MTKRATLLYDDQVQRFKEYHIDDGRRIRFRYDEIQHHGEAELLRRAGLHSSSERIPVMQSGRQVGTLPRDFDWTQSGVRSFLVDLRPGDFTLEGDRWLASRTLCPGDFEAIPAFRRH